MEDEQGAVGAVGKLGLEMLSMTWPCLWRLCSLLSPPSPPKPSLPDMLANHATWLEDECLMLNAPNPSLPQARQTYPLLSVI